MSEGEAERKQSRGDGVVGGVTINLELPSKATIVGKCHKIKPCTRIKFTCHREDRDEKGGQTQMDAADDTSTQLKMDSVSKRRRKGDFGFQVSTCT